MDYTVSNAGGIFSLRGRAVPARVMNQIAETDVTFTRRGRDWVGRCLICGGPLRFDAVTGEGATVEHILPRSLGGTSELRNLGITHASCNHEKGKRWDGGRFRRAAPERYNGLVERLQRERERRWREPGDTEAR
ncbi:MAG TPA: HNH endonuclease [Ktedonobacterales bacterium]|nr:HNH endonuclease [Ktedonobacterales bacterium]